MRALKYAIMLFLLPLVLHGTENFDQVLTEEDLKKVEVEEITQKLEARKRSQDIWHLRMAKDSLVRGNTDLALYFLDQVDNRSSKLELIKKRYKAIIYFVLGKHEDSLELLNDPRFSTIKNTTNICLLKILNKTTLKKSDLSSKEFLNCRNLTERYSKNDQFWFTNYEQLKLRQFKDFRARNFNDIQYVINNNELLSMWMKTAIYSNREKFVIDNLKYIPKEAYKSKRIRELIGLTYYRLGQKKKALSFIEDIGTANAENIKGNLNLENKEYELAFGHFKLALKNKENSANSLERAIPLAWLLGQWKDGRNLLERVVNKKLDERNRLALDAAFLIRQDKFQEANQLLRLLTKRFKNTPPREIEIMKSYVSLRLSEGFALEDSAEKNCFRFDGVNCWLQLQQSIWEDLGKTITREEDISYTKELSLEELKSKKEIKPLDEIPTIDQRDIEELDSKLVKITPGFD